MALRDVILSNRLMYEINKIVKKTSTYLRYLSLLNHYKKNKATSSFSELVDANFDTSWHTFYSTTGKNVLFIGTDPKQDKSGWVQAIQKHCQLQCFVNDEGGWGQLRSSTLAPSRNFETLNNILEEGVLSSRPISLIIMQSMGRSFLCKDLLALKSKYNFRIINIGMDERLAYKLGKGPSGYEDGISALNECVDLCLVTTPEPVSWYLKERVPALFFPLASSEMTYHPIENVKKKYDVGFIGSRYGVRGEIVEYLRRKGVSVAAWGPGWESGILPYEENNRFYNECKIVLGFGGIGYSFNFLNPKLRDFEVTLSGSFYITTYDQSLDAHLKFGVEIEGYRSKRELFQKVQFYLENDDKREGIAQMGRKRSFLNHTLDTRFSRLFDSIDRKALRDLCFI